MELSTNYNEAVRNLKANSNLTYFNQGSVAGSIISSTLDTTSSLVYTVNSEISNYKIDEATGEALDNIGSNLGIIRRQGQQNAGFITIEINPEYSYTINSLINLIYEKTGTQLEEIIIPTGTIITDSTGEKQYTLISDYILTNEGEDEHEVVTKNTDSAETVEAGELNTIKNPSNELSIILPYLNISNTNPISNGGDAESDENYRYRVSKYYQSNQSANEEAIRTAALSVPGVSNVIINSYKNGSGKVEVIVVSENPITTDALLYSVSNAINEKISAAEEVIVKKPDYIGIYLEIFLTFLDSTVDDEKKSTISSIKTSINDYINSLNISESLVMTEITKIIINNSNLSDWKIKSFLKGEYNIETGGIVYKDELDLNDQILENTQQFRTNNLLIQVYC